MPETPDSTDEPAWKREVAARIENARLVLLHTGKSEGLQWEIQKVIAVGDPRRLVLCVNWPGKLQPGLPTLNRARADALKAWTEFRDANGLTFPRGVPQAIGTARFVLFDADWTPRALEPPVRKLLWFLRGRDPDLSRETIESALVWLTWMLVPESAGRRFIRKVVNQVVVFVSFILLVALAFGLNNLLLWLGQP
jgi:hypothetical protein